MTFVALMMGAMNLNAGIGNFHFFVISATLSATIRYDFLAFVFASNVIFGATLVAAARWQILSKNIWSLQKRFR
jgi:hypothetical protein